MPGYQPKKANRIISDAKLIIVEYICLSAGYGPRKIKVEPFWPKTCGRLPRITSYATSPKLGATALFKQISILASEHQTSYSSLAGKRRQIIFLKKNSTLL